MLVFVLWHGKEYGLPRCGAAAPLLAMTGRRRLCVSIQHNTAIADGVSGLNEALTALAEQGIQMIYDETHMMLAHGNFVLAVSEGTYGGEHTSYYDLRRVEDGKIAEHWDVMKTIADEST